VRLARSGKSAGADIW
jgi:hypothetical protein